MSGFGSGHADWMRPLQPTPSVRPDATRPNTAGGEPIRALDDGGSPRGRPHRGSVIDTAARVNRETYYCASCGHYEHADVNAARNIRARGIAAEKAWRQAGAPLLERPQPRLRRRKNNATPPADTLTA